ncbi:hypothetical protein L9F63_003496, partial [Diploptera punctata]
SVDGVLQLLVQNCGKMPLFLSLALSNNARRSAASFPAIPQCNVYILRFLLYNLGLIFINRLQ